MKPYIQKVGLDWIMSCCHTRATCPDWLLAMESAYGHISMGHQGCPGDGR